MRVCVRVFVRMHARVCACVLLGYDSGSRIYIMYIALSIFNCFVFAYAGVCVCFCVCVCLCVFVCFVCVRVCLRVLLGTTTACH